MILDDDKGKNEWPPCYKALVERVEDSFDACGSGLRLATSLFDSLDCPVLVSLVRLVFHLHFGLEPGWVGGF